MLTLVAVAITMAAVPAAAAKQENRRAKTVDVQLLALNDFHGNLEPPTGGGGRITPPGGAPIDAGGAEYLATHIRRLEALNPNTLVVSAGDLIGASPLLSALFHDEPTIEAMNSLGLDLNAVGNHEFDEGADELRRMQDGGCHPVDGLPGRRSLRRRRVRLPRRQRLQPGRWPARGAVARADDPSAVRDPELRWREGGVHRDDARGHPVDRQPVGHRGL